MVSCRSVFRKTPRQREQVGHGRRGLHLQLFGRHVLQRALNAGYGASVGEMDDAEIDDLYRIDTESITKMLLGFRSR